MGEQKKNRIDMCEGPILTKMIAFSLPLMASGVLQLLFNAADIVVVGRFAGENSLAAVGSTGSLVNLLVNLFIGLSIGANIAAARFIGAKQKKEVSLTVHTSMALSIVCGLIMTVVGFFLSETALRLMATPEEVLPLAAAYLRIYFLGMTSNMIYNFGAAILRAAGDTKRPLFYLLTAGVINVILNLVFVILFKMDVAGVALATIISQTVSAALIVRCLVKEEGMIKLDLRSLKMEKTKLIMILKLGIPAGLQGCLFSLSNVVIQSSVNSFGNLVVAGNSAALNIEGFVYVSMNSFYQSCISFVGQNYGAGKYRRIDKVVLYAFGCVLVTGIALGLFCLRFSEELISVYSDNPDVIAAGKVRMDIIMKTYFLCGSMDVMVGALRGTGHSITPMIVSFVCVCGFRMLWIATVFMMPEYHRADTIYWSYPISWFLALFVNTVFFLFARNSYIHKTESTVRENFS